MEMWRRRLFQLLLPGVVMLVLVYSVLQSLNGERGIFTWRMVSKQVAQLEQENAGLREEVTRLQKQVARLRPPVDEDYMDELVRTYYPLGRKGEVIILVSPSFYGGSGTMVP